MAFRHLSCTDIAGLLADNVAPDFNFEEQLWFIARANPQEAEEYLHLILRTQFFVHDQKNNDGFFHNHSFNYFGRIGGSFFHDCSIDYSGTFSRIIGASKLQNLTDVTRTDTNVDSPTPRR